MASHERERALAVAAVAGVLERCWAVREGLDGVDWAWLLARLDEHGLGALMFAEAERAGVLERFPADARDRLRRRAEDTAAASAQLLAAALRAGALLDAAGIPWMPMKGVALAIVAPEYFATRSTSDFDVLVRPEDLERAAEALGRQLIRAAPLRDVSGNARTPEELIASGAHHAHEFRSADGVAVELHHRFPGLTARETAEAWGRAERRAHGSRSILVPALDDLLGVACRHTTTGHRNERALALRHFSDTAVLLALGADPDSTLRVYDIAGHREVESSLRVLREARAWVDARAPRSCAASRTFDPEVGESLAGSPARLATIARGLLSRMRAHGWRTVFPSRAFLEAKFGAEAKGRSVAALHLRRWSDAVRRIFIGR